jgi:hypothetical protein
MVFSPSIRLAIHPIASKRDGHCRDVNKSIGLKAMRGLALRSLNGLINVS